MREWWGSSDVVLKVSVSIIVFEVVLLFIGFGARWV
jgi:hypothetical protein